MALLSGASRLFLGDRAVVRVYLGDRMVWPPSAGGARLSASLVRSETPGGVRCTVGYAGATPTWYRYSLSVDGGPWTVRAESGHTDVTFRTLLGSRNRVKVESFDDTGLLAVALSNAVDAGQGER